MLNLVRKLKKEKLILMILGIGLLLVVFVGLSYAYFTAALSGDEESTTITVSGGSLNITYAGGAAIVVSNVFPQAAPITTKHFTVTGNNTTDLMMPYVLALTVDSNTFSDDALSYTLKSTNTSNNGTPVASIPTRHVIESTTETYLLGYGELGSGSGKVHTYELDIYFYETGKDQNIDQGKQFAAHVEISSPVLGETYYVSSSSGSDENDGKTELTAFASLDKINSLNLNPGDKVLFKSGDTWSGQLKIKNSGTYQSIITIDKYGGVTKPIINGNGTTTDIPLVLQNIKRSATVMVENSSFVTIKNLEITNFGGADASRAGIYVYNDSERNLEIYLNTAKSNITIEDCYIHNVNGDSDVSKNTGGIIFVGNINDILIKNNKITDVALSGIRVASGTDYFELAPNYKILRNINIISNYIEDTYGDGIVLSSVRNNGIIEHNLVNRYSNIPETETRNYGGIWTWNSNNIIIQHNEVANSVYSLVDGFPFDLDWYNENILIQYNYTHNNYGYALVTTRNAHNNIYRYNVSIDDGRRPSIGSLIAMGTPSKNELAALILEDMGIDSTDPTYDTQLAEIAAQSDRVRNKALEILRKSSTLIYNNIFYISAGNTANLFINNSNYQNSVDKLYLQFYNNIVIADGTLNFVGRSWNEVYDGNIENNFFYPSTVYDQSKIFGTTVAQNNILQNPFLISPNIPNNVISNGKMNKEIFNGFKPQASSEILGNGKNINNILKYHQPAVQDFFGNVVSTNNIGIYQGN